MYTYKARMMRVIDGDTLEVSIDLGMRVGLANQRLRLEGVNTPETYGVKKDSEEYKAGMEAKAFVDQWFGTHGPEIIITTNKDKRGKYGRWVCTVYYDLDEPSLNQELLDSEHAEPTDY